MGRDRLDSSEGAMKRLAPARACRWLLLLLGCGGPATDPGERGSPASIVQVPTADTAYSGERLTVRFVVRDRRSRPLARQPVGFTTQDGALVEAPVETDELGEIAVGWQLADEDRSQVLRATTGSQSVTVGVTSRPRVSALAVNLPPTVALGEVLAAQVRGISSRGRTVPWQDSYTLEVVSEERTIAGLAVLAPGAGLRAVGPGSAEVRAVSGTLASAPARVTVPRQAILIGVRPAEVSSSGGIVQLLGYDLDRLLVAPELRGVTAAVRSRSDTTIDLELPSWPPGCQGRTRFEVSAPEAWMPQGLLSVRRRRDGDLVLGVGEVRRFGPSATQCLQLDGVAGAEYVAAYFDTRGIESARLAPEDPLLGASVWSLEIVDQTAAGTQVRGGLRASATAFSEVRDILPARLTAANVPDDYYSLRATPWAPGDRFSMPFEGSSVVFDRGTIFAVEGPFAFGVLDKDSAFRIPERLVGMREAVANFQAHGEPLLRRAWIDERAVTTEGSGQMLVLTLPWTIGSGWLVLGTGTVDRGVWVGINPGLEGTPSSDPLFLQEELLFHEMVHAWQDRYWMRQCATAGDCGSGTFQHRWAVEGIAEFLKQLALADRHGLGWSGNHSLSGRILGLLGKQSWVPGNGSPFDAGYDNSSWFFHDQLARGLRAGLPTDRLLQALARGAYDGWFGWRMDGGPARRGLVGRMAELRGAAWDPVVELLTGVLTLAADDRTASAALQFPWLENAWSRWPSSGLIDLGQGQALALRAAGLLFGYVRVNDAEGWGGSVELRASHPGVAWGIVRVR